MAALLLIVGVTAAAAADVAGEVLTAKGTCFVETAGSKRPLAVGDAVRVGDTVEVPEGAKLKLRLKDGSVVSAGSGTRLAIETFDSDGARRDAKLSLASGLVRAVVSAVSQPSRFEVETATGVAAVRSTDWFIETRPDGTQVGVLEGAVSLTSTATHRSVTIPARWGARVEAGRSPVPGRLWTQAEFDDVIARTSAE